MDLLSACEFAIKTAHQAGDMLLKMLADGLDADRIRAKTGHFDIVTEADVASETMILGALRTVYPAIPIFAEESAHGPAPDAEWLWVVDPVDGTTNFSHALPIWGVNIALVHRGAPVIGVTHDPSSQRTYWAVRGEGAWVRSPVNETRLHVSQTRDIQRALLATGFQYNRLDPAEARRTEFALLDNMSQSVRRHGSAAIVSAWVACGYLEAYWETALKPWDFAPGWVLIEEAGGRLTEHDGSALHLNSPGVIMSNGQPGIHETIREVIAAVATGHHDSAGTFHGPGASGVE